MGAMASGGGGWVCDCPPVEQGWRIAGIWLMAEFGNGCFGARNDNKQMMWMAPAHGI